MKCPYCKREVTPNGKNCPKCKAEIVKSETKAEVKSESKKEEK